MAQATPKSFNRRDFNELLKKLPTDIRRYQEQFRWTGWWVGNDSATAIVLDVLNVQNTPQIPYTETLLPPGSVHGRPLLQVRTHGPVIEKHWMLSINGVSYMCYQLPSWHLRWSNITFEGDQIPYPAYNSLVYLRLIEPGDAVKERQPTDYFYSSPPLSPQPSIPRCSMGTGWTMLNRIFSNAG